MSRANRIAAIASALFVLHVPLCALACLPAADLAHEVAMDPGSTPCHASESDAASDAPAAPHEDCRCGDASIAVPSGGVHAASVPHERAPMPADFAAVRHVRAEQTRAPVRLRTAHLPPPDILRLESVLLI